jgi:cytochrome c5
VAGIVMEFLTAPPAAEVSGRDPTSVDAALVRLTAVAAAVVAAHVDEGGICKSCLEDSARLAPVPCESARWGRAVLDTYGHLYAAARIGASS